MVRPSDDSLDARHAYAIYRAGLIEDLGDNLWICGKDGPERSGQGQGKGRVVVHRVGHTFPQLIHKVLYKTWGQFKHLTGWLNSMRMRTVVDKHPVW